MLVQSSENDVQRSKYCSLLIFNIIPPCCPDLVLLFLCLSTHPACCHIALWTSVSLCSWRSCWPGNSWSTPLKRRSPSRQYACGSRSAWNAYGRSVNNDTEAKSVYFPTIPSESVCPCPCRSSSSRAASSTACERASSRSWTASSTPRASRPPCRARTTTWTTQTTPPSPRWAAGDGQPNAAYRPRVCAPL